MENCMENFTLEPVVDFGQAYLTYCKENPWLLAVIAGLFLGLIAVAIVIICVSVSVAKKRRRKAAEAKAAEEAKETATPEPLSDAQPETVAEEIKEEPAAQPADEPVKEAVTEEIPVTPAPEEAPAKAEKKPTAKQESKPVKAAKTAEETDAEKQARYKGKWVIYRLFTDEKDSEEMYFFELRASNGEKLLTSEEYTSYNGAVRGIATHKANIEKGNFKITLSKKGYYIFKLLSGKNTLLCMGENYPSKARCEKAIESTKRFAETATLDENVQEQLVKIPKEDDTAAAPLPDGYNGKWVIESGEGAEGETVFYFVLYANNGEKLLTSEEYTTYVGAVNGIATHKKNIEAGNFRITLTKRGDYIYKLLNGNGQLLCLGEHYKTRRLCQSAVDSVKRFALNSPMLTDSAHTK